MVAAFDNNGAISYPAAFDEVIGVDFDITNKRVHEFTFVKNSPINIRGIGTEVVVPWLDSKTKTVGGSSFAAPYISSIIFNYLCENEGTNKVHQFLENTAKKIVTCDLNPQKLSNKISWINRAIIFPYNKEMHSILRYNDLLNFKIDSVYDVKNLGNINKNVSDLQSIRGNIDWTIKNYKDIDWVDEFDTVILGHTEELGNALEIDLLEEFVKNCEKFNKKLYCFDDLTRYEKIFNVTKERENFWFFPRIDNTFVNKNTFGRLRHVGVPVIAVVGTGSKQGKFTLQLELRARFVENDYTIKQLGSEPSSLLFGFDSCIPVGYRSTVDISGYDLIKVVNDAIGKMEDEKAEIIMVGTQSNTIPLTTGFIGFYPLYNTDILLGSEPDICILSVNFNDDVNYIKRTISYLENYISTKVLALVIFPVMRDSLWSSLTSRGVLIEKNKLNEKKNELFEKTKINVYILGDSNEMDKLYNDIIDFF